jgi:predicted ATPase
LLVPSVTGIDVATNNLGELELCLRENGPAIPARVLSEGTVRLLGLLILVGGPAPPGLVGLEEPENGVHPRRLGLLAEYLNTRRLVEDSQFIVTTHSPHLLDCLPLTALYICRRHQGQTVLEPFLQTQQGEAAAGELEQAGEPDKESVPVSARVLRGDFDA